MNDDRHTQVELILKEHGVERRFKAFGMLWANEAESKAILENLPDGVVEHIKQQQQLSHVY